MALSTPYSYCLLTSMFGVPKVTLFHNIGHIGGWGIEEQSFLDEDKKVMSFQLAEFTWPELYRYEIKYLQVASWLSTFLAMVLKTALESPKDTSFKNWTCRRLW